MHSPRWIPGCEQKLVSSFRFRSLHVLDLQQSSRHCLADYTIASSYQSVCILVTLSDMELGCYNPHQRFQLKDAHSLPHQPGMYYGCVTPFVTASVVSPSDLLLETRLGSQDLYLQSFRGAGLVHSFATLHGVAHHQGKMTEISNITL